MYWAWRDLTRGDLRWKRMIACRILRSAVSWPFRSVATLFFALDPLVMRAQPWGILFAAIGLLLAVFTFWIDFRDRIEERTVRAWQLLTTDAPGNSGKIDALEYLNSRDRFCILGTCKIRTPLIGINLSKQQGTAAPFLSGVDLSNAYLQHANLSGANLNFADLSGAQLYSAELEGTMLVEANLSEGDLFQTNLSKAILWRADLSRADLGLANVAGADLKGANINGANLYGTIGIVQ